MVNPAQILRKDKKWGGEKKRIEVKMWKAKEKTLKLLNIYLWSVRHIKRKDKHLKKI